MSINYAVSALKTSWRTVVQINRTVQLLELKFYFESSQHWVTVRAWQRIARNTNFGSVKLKFYGGQHLSWSATLLTSTLLLHSYKVATCYVSLQQQVISRHARRGLHRESNKKMFHDHIILLSYLINDLLLSFEKQNCIDDLESWLLDRHFCKIRWIKVLFQWFVVSRSETLALPRVVKQTIWSIYCTQIGGPKFMDRSEYGVYHFAQRYLQNEWSINFLSQIQKE